jgi:hypothetical protein
MLDAMLKTGSKIVGGIMAIVNSCSRPTLFGPLQKITDLRGRLPVAAPNELEKFLRHFLLVILGERR